MVWYPEFYCLALIMFFLFGLILWDKFGARLLQILNDRKRR